MFSFKRSGSSDAKVKITSNEDDFGWWLNSDDNFKLSTSSRSKDCQSLASSESMFSCVDSDDSESYSLAQEFKPEANDGYGGIELSSLIYDDLRVDLIEQDAIDKDVDVTPFPAKEATEYPNEAEVKPRRTQGMCYTPERLVRCQEYRILTPSPRCLSISEARIMTGSENSRKAFRCRRRLNYLIDPKQVAESAVSAITSHHWKSCRVCGSDDSNSDDNVTKTASRRKSGGLQITDLIGTRPSCEKLNVTWEDCKKMGTPSSSLDDTSGIQSNDWSSDTHSDLQNTPLCLCDELASTNYKLETSQERCSAINEVVSILEVLDTDPERAAILLEEDRFCDSTSSHDQLTRLALAIETDANVPGVLENPEQLVHHLQKKVEKLQNSSKDIFRDIRNLRKSFQNDEEKMTNISSSAIQLRQDVNEMRYLDDLLNLLQGELDRISKRNWPFVIGRTEYHPEEMNLIV